MKLTSKIILATNVLVIGSMAGTFYFHVQEEKAKIEALQNEVNSKIEYLVNKAAEEEASAQAVIARIEYKRQLECLATNLYHEASIEGDKGKEAVAWATLNRVHHKDYPDTICEVVHQANLDENGNPIKNECQFSWYCDGKSDVIESETGWRRSLRIAEEVLMKYGKETDPTGGAIMYHADYVDPFWVSEYDRVVQIDTHVFYR